MNNNHIVLCLMARRGYDHISTSIFNCLQEKHRGEIECVFVTSNTQETKYVEKHVKTSKFNCKEVSSYFNLNWNDFTEDKLIYYEHKYDCSPIWKYIYTDRFLINQDREYCIKTAIGFFAFFEMVFNVYNVDYYYDEAISTLETYIAYIVGLRNHTKYVSLLDARGAELFGKYHYYSIDPNEMAVEMSANYVINEYSEDEMLAAETYLSEFEKQEMVPDYMRKTGKRPRLSFRFFLAPVQYLRLKLNKREYDKYFYMYYKMAIHAFDEPFFYFRYLKSQRYYSKADYSKKFVYFPLHYQPESSTLVCAQKYEKQLFYIDSWAKSIPADTWLYVKEHYAVLGHRSLSFYKELKKYPNVVLIDPWESSRKLIEHACAVTTLTGTAGWEAMLLRKPVFLGGSIFFDYAPGIIKINDIYDRYIDLINKWEQPSRKDVIKYLCEYFRALHPGYADAGDRKMDRSNYENLADSLYMFILSNKVQNENTVLGGKDA